MNFISISNHSVEYLYHLKIFKESGSTVSLSATFQYLANWNSSYYLIYNPPAVKINMTVFFYSLGREGEQFVTNNQTIINVPKLKTVLRPTFSFLFYRLLKLYFFKFPLYVPLSISLSSFPKLSASLKKESGR